MLNSSFKTIRLSLVAVRVGSSAAQCIASMKVASALSPLILGEAIAANVAMSGTAQMEAVFYVVTRVSLHSPSRLAWLLNLITRFTARCAGCGTGSASVTSWLAQKSFLRQVTAVGLQGSAASALAAAAVQLSMQTCYLVKKSILHPSKSKLARRQFYHETITIVSSGGASIVGGGCGAVLGGLMLPGIGTALGSLVGSVGAGYVPCVLRGGGPEGDVERAKQEAALQFNPDRPLKVEEDEDGWLVVMDCENESRFMFYDRIEMADVEAGPLESDAGPTAGRATQSAETENDFDMGEHEEDSEDPNQNDFIELVDGKDFRERLDNMACGDEEMLLFLIPVFDTEATEADVPTAQTPEVETTDPQPSVAPSRNCTPQ